MIEVRDPNYKERVSASFHRQQVMSTLGVTLESVEPGSVVLAFPYNVALTQQHGFIHAGIVSTVLDSACGYAAFSLMPADASVLSIEFKVNLLAPAKGESFRAVAEVLKPGRTISVVQAELFARDGESEKRVAQMTGTMMTIIDRDGVREPGSDQKSSPS